jgi:HlyD family secretion protein
MRTQLRMSRGIAELLQGPCTLALVISTILFSFGCSEKSKEAEPIVPVQTATVKREALQQTISAEAVLFPLQQAALTPKISAPVKRFYVQRGSKVHKDQLLAVLENRDLAAAAQENRGSLGEAQATYESTTAASLPEEIEKAKLDAQAAQQSLEAAEKVYTSRQGLFQQGALPRKELDQANLAYIEARNNNEIAQRHLQALLAVGQHQQLKAAKGQLEAAEGKYQGATAQLSYSEIRSPIDGVVTERPLYAGEMAAAGTPLMTVMDASAVTARTHIPQQQASLLRVGDKATVTVTGNDSPSEGKVTLVSPALDPSSTTVEVWVLVPNAHGNLRPGSSVQVTMVAKTISDALTMPNVALLTGQDGTNSVMLVGSDGRAHQQTVEPGVRQDDRVQIVEGLKEGDRVVTAGAYGLPDNAKIKIEDAPEK